MSHTEAPSLIPRVANRLVASITPSPTSMLTLGEAGSRLVIVFVIQLLGVVFLVVPLMLPGIKNDGWQQSCRRFGGLAAIGLVLLLGMFVYAAWQHFHDQAFDVRKTELAITLAFVLNTVALALAMARTGGPSCSTYGQMIPMQLSGMLLLAQQKQTFTSDQSFQPVIYAAITLFFWGSSVLFWQQLAHWRGWATTIGTNERGYGFLSPGLLIFCEILLMAIAYFVPRKFSPRDKVQQSI
jgi:hypothetical protein